MKKYLVGFFVLLVVFILSCEQSKNGIEIIPNYYKEYHKNIVRGKAQAVFADSLIEKNLKKNLIEFTKKLKPDAGEIPIVFSIDYDIYISDSGDIDKIKNDVSYQDYIRLLNSEVPFDFYNDIDKMDQEFVKLIEKWKFKPAIIDDKNVKSVENFEASIKYYSPDSIEVFFYTNLSYLSDEARKYNVIVEQMPEPIGGIAGIQKRITYPEIARRAGIQGRVFIKAFINENGDVADAEILKGIGAGCDEAAIKAVKETKFIPGKQKGKPAKVQISIPILFRLN